MLIFLIFHFLKLLSKSVCSFPKSADCGANPDMRNCLQGKSVTLQLLSEVAVPAQVALAKLDTQQGSTHCGSR